MEHVGKESRSFIVPSHSFLFLSLSLYFANKRTKKKGKKGKKGKRRKRKKKKETRKKGGGEGTVELVKLIFLKE